MREGVLQGRHSGFVGDGRIVKLVRALRKGWIKTTAERRVSQEEQPAYLLWDNDGLVASTDKTATGDWHRIPNLETQFKALAESVSELAVGEGAVVRGCVAHCRSVLHTSAKA